jgi:hypothetical protein
MNFRFDHQGATVVLNVANFSQHWIAPYAEPSIRESEVPEPQLQRF